MTEDQPDPQGPNDFSADPDPFGEQPEAGPSPFDDQSAPSSGDEANFALDMARIWIKEHQTKSMLGAFAVGVFVGALFRD